MCFYRTRLLVASVKRQTSEQNTRAGRGGHATHAGIVLLDRTVIFKVKSSFLSRHHFFFSFSQTILAYFAIALCVRLGPIPQLVLLPANLASRKFEFSEFASRGVSSEYRACECITPGLLFSKKFWILFFFSNLIFIPLFQLEINTFFQIYSQKFNLFLIIESASRW